MRRIMLAAAAVSALAVSQPASASPADEMCKLTAGAGHADQIGDAARSPLQAPFVAATSMIAASAPIASFHASVRFLSPGRPSGLMTCTAIASTIRSESAFVMSAA